MNVQVWQVGLRVRDQGRGGWGGRKDLRQASMAERSHSNPFVQHQ